MKFNFNFNIYSCVLLQGLFFTCGKVFNIPYINQPIIWFGLLVLGAVVLFLVEAKDVQIKLLHKYFKYELCLFFIIFTGFIIFLKHSSEITFIFAAIIQFAICLIFMVINQWMLKRLF